MSPDSAAAMAVVTQAWPVTGIAKLAATCLAKMRQRPLAPFLNRRSKVLRLSGRQAPLAYANARAPTARAYWSRIVACTTLALLICPTVTNAQTYDIRPGQAVAVDGDTLRIGSQRIRLSAMDAPELSQVCRSDAGKPTLCGRDSRDGLSRLIRQGVRCSVETQDRYGREVATCTNAAGLDVGREMIRQGWAVPYWRYGGARYSKAYDEALAADAGMHAGTFIDPEQWRRGERW